MGAESYSMYSQNRDPRGGVMYSCPFVWGNAHSVWFGDSQQHLKSSSYQIKKMFLKKTTKSFFVSRSKQLSKIRPYGEQAWAYSVRSYPSTCQSIKGVIHPKKKKLQSSSPHLYAEQMRKLHSPQNNSEASQQNTTFN